MPTEPIEAILNRDLSRVAAAQLREQCVPLLEEVVNHGTAVYARCKPAVSASQLDESDVPLLLFLHILEMTDGVAELLNQSCASPAVPLVRTIFEAQLNLEYLLSADSPRRCRSWLVAYALEQLEGCDHILGVGESGKQLKAAMERDGGAVSHVDLSALQPVARLQKDQLETYLGRREFDEIHAARKLSKQRFPKWYSLFGGPYNFGELARSLNHATEYRMLYSFWSSIDHGLNTRRFLTRAATADRTVRLIRDSAEFLQVASTTVTFVLRATRLVLARYRPSESLETWYLKEVRPRFMVPRLAPS